MKRKRIEYILKHNQWILSFFVICGSLFFRIIGLFVKKDQKLVLFVSFSGKQYNDSPKCIFERMKASSECKSLKYAWAFEQPDLFPQVDSQKVKIDSWNYFITALKAKYWVANVNIERGLKFKDKTTFYLNTWHGAAINLMGKAVKGRSDFNWDHIDCFCISGKYEVPIIKRDFSVKQESLLFSGLPRNDELYHASSERIHELRLKLEIPDNKKVILYAPTWRESTDGGENCLLKPPIDYKKWDTMLKKDFIVFIRAHVNTQKILNIQYNDTIRNASDYPAVNDLLLVSDYLISDYSSIIMDYCILGRPIVCFGYDYDEYKKKRGGFYFDLDKEIPSGICHTEDDVLSYILNCNYDNECIKARRFRDSFIEYGGNATNICIDKILKYVKGDIQQ